MTTSDHAALKDAAMREAVALGGMVAALIVLQHWEQISVWGRAAWLRAARPWAPVPPRRPTVDDMMAWRRDIARLDGENIDPA